MMLFAAQTLMKGFVLVIVAMSMMYMLREYHIGGSQMQIYVGVACLPFAIKPAIGLVSDAFPIFGYHKTPYMLMSCVLGLVGLLLLALHLCGNGQGAVMAIFVVMLMLSTIDLLTEASYAAAMKRVPAVGPDLMSYVWFGFTSGCLGATLITGPIMEKFSIHAPYFLAIPAVLFTMVLLALNYMGEEQRTAEQVAETRARLVEQGEACFLCILMLVCAIMLTCVGTIFSNVYINAAAGVIVITILIVAFAVLLRPAIARVNTFFVLQTALNWSLGGATFYFFIDNATAFPEGPHFSIVFYSTVLGILSSVFSLVGVYTYQQYWKNWRYRSLIIFTNLVSSGLSLIDCMIYSRWNLKLGIPDHAFVLGSNVLETTIGQWMYIPGIVIIAQLCPKDMEAMMFALLAGSHNIGGTVGGNCGALLLKVMNIEPNGTAGDSEQFSNLWLASAITVILPLLTLLLVPCLIPDASQEENLISDNETSATEGSLYKRWKEWYKQYKHRNDDIEKALC
eukprot:NODE_4943_length_1828_cov_3.999412.p1 GENE.NODE_4943_length_1828_cov_3.999412~~NODE_4943_length_1828_cov_3.999412.p1  ORF type:complete len:509 (-),score=152.74 NODE_4943_length_1828_cov_3.999412:201-1727(-)